MQMRLAQRAVVQPLAIARRDFALAALPAHRMDAVVERRVGSLGRVDGHRADRDRGVEDPLQTLRRVNRERSRTLRAIEQRKPFLRSELERREACMREAAQGRHALAFDNDLTDAQQHAAQMRERREVARRADRAFLGNDRQHVGIEQREQGIDDVAAHTRHAMRKARGLQQQHQAHDRRCERLADAGAVRQHEVLLQLRQLVVGDARLRELAEAGVDAVDRLVARHQLAHRTHARIDALARRPSERELGVARNGPLQQGFVEPTGRDEMLHGVRRKWPRQL